MRGETCPGLLRLTPLEILFHFSVCLGFVCSCSFLFNYQYYHYFLSYYFSLCSFSVSLFEAMLFYSYHYC